MNEVERSSARVVVVDAIGSAIPPSRVIWDAADDPRVAQPYAVMRVVTSRRLAIGERRTASPNIEHRQWWEHQVDVQIVATRKPGAPSSTESAEEIASRMCDRLLRQSSIELRNARQLALRDVSGPVSADRIALGSQWETRAAVTFTFGTCRLVVEEPEFTASIEGEGEFNTDDGAILVEFDTGA